MEYLLLLPIIVFFARLGYLTAELCYTFVEMYIDYLYKKWMEK